MKPGLIAAGLVSRCHDSSKYALADTPRLSAVSSRLGHGMLPGLPPLLFNIDSVVNFRAATLLQSSAVAYRYGISGPWWYAGEPHLLA